MSVLRAEEREEAELEAGGDEPLVTVEDAAEVLGEVESPLRVPAGYKIVTMAPAEAELDPMAAASDVMVDNVIMLRFEHYGWCKGTITGKITDRRRSIGGDRVNFVAKFDIDDGETTDLSLNTAMYDTSPSAAYEAWMLLEPEAA